MSVNVDVMVFRYKKLFDATRLYIEKETNKPVDGVFLGKVFEQFGNKVGDYFIMLSDEHADDYNSYFSLSEFIDRFYQIEDSYNVISKSLLDDFEWHNSDEEAAENLGVELPDEEEDK